MKKGFFAAASLALIFFVSLSFFWAQSSRAGLSPLEDLGKRLFFDKNLSSPTGQDCSACHGQTVGFTGPDELTNRSAGIYEGAVKGRFGNRKPPAAAYAGDSPKLQRDEEGNFFGGMFWDGRAMGDTLGDPLAEQALGPFTNRLEQNMPDSKSVILAVKKSDYAGLFEKVWGPGSLDADKDLEGTYARIGRSIAAYERSAEVNPFNSKFDDFWRAAKAKGLKAESINASNASSFKSLGLSETELRGLVLFNTKGLCSKCHIMTVSNDKPPVLTDYTYDNLGIPRNPENPFFRQEQKYNPDGKAWLDPGLGGALKSIAKYQAFAAENKGKHRVPTLRNVDLRPSPGFIKAYAHNGYFKNLKDIVHFYNTRDKAGVAWPPPEIAVNVNKTEMGNLGLSDDEENAIVEFMKALSDRP